MYNYNMNNDYCVYCHKNRLNNKRYIGITCQNPQSRWRNGKGYINNDYFYRSIQKYGWDNFEHIILHEKLTKEKAELLEIKIISEYKTTNPNFGYNIERGGNSTEKFTNEIKQKISNSLKGHVCSEETRRKISEANKGKTRKKRGKMSLENIEKNRIGHFGQTPWNKGRPWSPEEKAKCGGKPVKCIELNKIYRSAHEAGESLNIDFSSICKCTNGKAKTAGGYHWILAEEWRLTDG